MANNPGEGDDFREHLDATGEREVVYCHLCTRQWYRDEYGLVCPGCEGDIIEIVSSDIDPRPPIQRPPTPPGFHALRNHDPWGAGGDSDPEEEDIEEHITHTHGPGNSVIFTRTIRSSTPVRPGNRNRREPTPGNDSDNMMGNYQSMIGNLLGPQFQIGQAGRSGPGTLFNQDDHMHGGENGPRIAGARFTFTTTGGRAGPRDPNGPQPGGPPIDTLATLLGGILGQMGGNGGPDDDAPPGLPPAIHAIFSQIFNPANARAGDAVYTQEALDNIVTGLMEQHTASNAPGPASSEAIAALPKKRLDYDMLGPEGKGECSVCMDDVKIGDEMVVLPCTHWFHEACASIWLKEHNTCPICRKGIGSEGTPPAQSGPPRNETRSGRLNGVNRPRDLNRPNSSSAADRNQARLQAIRNLGQRSPSDGNPPFQFHVVGDGHRHSTFTSFNPQIPGSFPSQSSPRPRPLLRSESERIRHERPRDTRRSSQSSGSNTAGSEIRRGSHTSGSHTSGVSRRSSQSGSGGSGNTGGAFGWLRNHLGGGGSSNRRHD